MFGDAVPIRFSRRIKRSSILPVRVSPKKKIRKSPFKKRTSGVNSSLLKVKGKTKFGEKNKLRESPKQASKILKQASRNLKPFTHKSSQISLSKIHGKERKAKKFQKTSQINLTNNQVTLKNPKSFDNSKKVLQKKYYKKTDNEEKQPIRRSLRLSKSSPSSEEKNEEISDPKWPQKRLSQKKCTKQATTLSSELVLTPNLEKWTHKSKLSGRKKAAKFSTEGQTQEIYNHIPTTKSLTVTSATLKVTCTSRHLGNQKSGRLSRSSIMKSEISLNTSSFHSLLETPLSQKHSEKRKSTRLIEPSSLETLNKKLPLSTSASLLASNSGYVLNKSSKSCKSVKHLSPKSCSRKSNSIVFNKDGLSVSHEKQKCRGKQYRKTSENSKKPLSNKSQNLPLNVFATPSPHGRSLSKKCLSKSDSKSSKRKLNASASEKQVANETLQDAKKRKSTDFPKIPTKGTLKYKRWLLNNLKEKSGSYEDDIFENQKFDLYTPAFHLGDESDGSSINIATPKFDCILTPALPKKTPRFKDCISPTEFLQARKTAEEYLFRRNKKRKSEEKISSEKKTSVYKKQTAQEIPEKKKLDFEEAVNKLIAVQKNLEVEAEVDDEEEDAYFSDA